LYDGTVFKAADVDKGFYDAASTFQCKTSKQIKSFVTIARKTYQEQRAALAEAQRN
jgi:hypothetical protein